MIVTVLLARETLNEANRQAIVHDLAKKRITAINAISQNRATHSPVSVRRGPNQVEARYEGFDKLQGVRLAFVVRASPAKVVTVAITRYFLETVGAPFGDYAGTIFDFLELKCPEDVVQQ